MSQVIQCGKTEHKNKPQTNYTASARALPDKDFKAHWGFTMCCSSSFEEAQKIGRMSRIIDTADGNTHQAYFTLKSDDLER